MSLSNSTLSAIQRVGGAAFTADAKLKKSVRQYAERVNAAMAANPYGLGNDALFENWKGVARLSQTLAGIEEELRKVYRVARELTEDASEVLQSVLDCRKCLFTGSAAKGNANPPAAFASFT